VLFCRSRNDKQKIKNAMKKILQILRDGITKQINALAGATTTEAAELRNGLQAQLNSLAELDKLTESDAGTAFLEMIRQQQEHAGRLFGELQTAQANLATASQQLKDLNARVTAGDLVEKAKVTERCELARQEGVASRDAEIMGLRKQVVTGLPELPENILKLPTAEFASAITEAKANLAAAQAAGLALDGRGDKFLRRALFLGKDKFTSELAELQEFSTGAAPNLNGGAGGGDKDKEVPAAPRFRIC
jgi:hypothetical protein